jgi:MYXO-CTERM domain-containing protein
MSQFDHSNSLVLCPSRALPLAAALVLLATGAAGDAHADEGVGDRPATWDMSIEQLQEIGLGQVRADPIPAPATLPPETAPVEPQAGGAAGVIFVNFDGAQLTSGSDSSQNNRTQIGQLAGNFAAYGAGAKRDAVMQAVQTDWAAFNVLVTDSRPASGDYTMNMTGPTNPFGGGVLGIAPLDCNDQQTHNNITYAFHSVNDQHSASTTATTIGQEVAHSYGLEHVNEPGDIMNPFNAGGDPSFIDQCIQIDGGGNGILCTNQHAANCGSGSQQNSYQELMNLFGPSAPDTALPVVSVTSPLDGDEFDAGASFDIVVDANDDTGLQELVLYNNGAAIETDGSAPWGWEVTNVPEGTYELYVEASDLAGNVAMSNVVTVYVGTSAPPPAGDGGSADGGGSDGGSGPAGDGGGGGSDGGDGSGDGGGGEFASEDDALPPGFGGSGSGQGCACTSGPGVGPGARWGAGLAMIVLFGLRRRQRR